VSSSRRLDRPCRRDGAGMRRVRHLRVPIVQIDLERMEGHEGLLVRDDRSLIHVDDAAWRDPPRPQLDAAAPAMSAGISTCISTPSRQCDLPKSSWAICFARSARWSRSGGDMFSAIARRFALLLRSAWKQFEEIDLADRAL
jgi:hypothetical protein